MGPSVKQSRANKAEQTDTSREQELFIPFIQFEVGYVERDVAVAWQIQLSASNCSIAVAAARRTIHRAFRGS